MKFIKILSVLLMFSAGISAQTFNAKAQPQLQVGTTRGNFGTYQPYSYILGNHFTLVTNTVTPVASGHNDTLVIPVTSATGYGTDTGYAQFYLPSALAILVDLGVTSISGTLAGTSLLQCSIDNKTWHTITGNTTYCTDCKGASATLTGSGETHYQWAVPSDFVWHPYWQVRSILSGTATATYTVTAGYKY